MFSGIVEATGKIINKTAYKANITFEIASVLSKELKVDQSIAHNGVCLTVIEVKETSYLVTAVEETLLKSNLGLLELGEVVNLERSLMLDSRLDGHIVQGHVDQTGECLSVKENGGSWVYTFGFNQITGNNVTVEKGSIAVNGISLTVFNSKPGMFSVAVIPYTFEHTNIKYLKEGSIVNLEFDIIGKYVKRLVAGYN